MPTLTAQYNDEVLQAHREALAALRDLLAAEKDPAERRRLAVAMLKARQVPDPEAPATPRAANQTAHPQPRASSRSPGALNTPEPSDNANAEPDHPGHPHAAPHAGAPHTLQKHQEAPQPAEPLHVLSNAEA